MPAAARQARATGSRVRANDVMKGDREKSSEHTDRRAHSGGQSRRAGVRPHLHRAGGKLPRRARCAPRYARDRSSRVPAGRRSRRSEEHTSELQSLMRISYAVFCLKKKNKTQKKERNIQQTKQDILDTQLLNHTT